MVNSREKVSPNSAMPSHVNFATDFWRTSSIGSCSLLTSFCLAKMRLCYVKSIHYSEMSWLDVARMLRREVPDNKMIGCTVQTNSTDD